MGNFRGGCLFSRSFICTLTSPLQRAQHGHSFQELACGSLGEGALFCYHNSFLSFLLEVLSFTFRSMTHLSLIFVHSVKQGSRLAFFPYRIQSTQCRLLKRPSFPSLSCSRALVVDQGDHSAWASNPVVLRYTAK